MSDHTPGRIDMVALSTSLRGLDYTFRVYSFDFVGSCVYALR